MDKVYDDGRFRIYRQKRSGIFFFLKKRKYKLYDNGMYLYSYHKFDDVLAQVAWLTSDY
jgi:hypothetical protein